ncbi:MAG: ABC transporter substrate-binding protein [Deltaproteobacteria bacterium]|nr:ABC transporter substrate-binding protein [Deltaproteobacteria bacterium]
MPSLRIGYLSTMYHTSHILKACRWVETLGVTAEWNLFGTGPAMVKAFTAGELDIGYIGLPPAMIGIGKGLPLTCIGGGHAEGTVMIGPDSATACDETHPLNDVLQQFTGKTIAAPTAGSIHDVIARYFIKHHQVAGASMRNYPWADLMPAAIDDNEISAAFGTPPLAVVARKWHGHRIVIPAAKIWPFNPSYGIVVHTSLLPETALLEGFLTQHERACNLIINQTDEAAAIVAKAVAVVDPDFVREVFAVSPRYCAALPREYIDATMAFIPVLKDMQYLKRNLTEDEVFDFSIIDKVHPEPHHYFDKLAG